MNGRTGFLTKGLIFLKFLHVEEQVQASIPKVPVQIEELVQASLQTVPVQVEELLLAGLPTVPVQVSG